MPPTHHRRFGLLALIAATAGAICWGTARADDAPRAGKDNVESPAHGVRVELDGSGARLAAAEAAYAEADARMPDARAALADALRDLDGARIEDGDLRRRLEIAVEEEATTQREVLDVEAAMEDMRDALGRVARRVYQQGALARLSLVVQAETPGQMLSRLEGFRTLMRADETALARLKDVRSEGDGRRKALARASDRVRLAREAVVAHLSELGRSEAEAAAATSDVENLVGQRRVAMATAEEEKAADRQRYEVLVAERRALTDLVNRVNAPSKTGRTPSGRDRGGALSYPVDADVTSTFGSRFHPILDYVKMHTGADFAAPEGTPVHAARDGVVIAVDATAAGGNRVVVSHGRVGGVALATTYNHLSRVDVTEGALLVRGADIGLVGDTGYSAAPHLHFEVLVDGEFADPLAWL